MDQHAATLRGAHHVIAIQCIATQIENAVTGFAALREPALQRLDLPPRVAQLPRHFTADAARCTQYQNFLRHITFSRIEIYSGTAGGIKEIAEYPPLAIHLCMTKNIGWELYRSFLAVLTHGSLSAAARALGITQPTVGRHIAELEASFKQTLFTRSRTGLMPTEAALTLRSYAEAMHSNAAALERAMAGQGQTTGGTVRITASEVIAVEVLPPALAQLRQAHPQLTIELVATNRVQDLLQREADIAVRMTAPKQEQLIARSVGHVKVGLHARTDYLQQFGTPALPADLARHTVIGFDTETPFLRAASKRVPGWGREGFPALRQRPGATGLDPRGRGHRFLPVGRGQA